MITICGAGPVGCHTARLLAEAGHEVTVLEEHKEIGTPVQCTGIVTQSINEVIRLPKNAVVNRLRKVRLHSPCGNTAEIRSRDIVIDRSSFDKHIAGLAEKKGATILTGTRLEAIRKAGHALRIRTTGTAGRTRTTNTDALIGADGPNSIVSRFIGNRKPISWTGVQALIKMPVEKNTYSVHFGDEFPGFFGWVVPEDEETARAGIAAEKNAGQVFRRFMNKLGSPKQIQIQGGPIPRYEPRTILDQGSAYIVGDAATQVKATTGGGLVPGMKSAECLARSISSARSGNTYQKELAEVRKELRMSLMLRNILDRFSEKDYDELVKLAGQSRMQNILNKADRDRPTRVVFKSLINEPKLLLFARTLFRAKRL